MATNAAAKTLPLLPTVEAYLITWFRFFVLQPHRFFRTVGYVDDQMPPLRFAIVSLVAIVCVGSLLPTDPDIEDGLTFNVFLALGAGAAMGIIAFLCGLSAKVLGSTNATVISWNSFCFSLGWAPILTAVYSAATDLKSLSLLAIFILFHLAGWYYVGAAVVAQANFRRGRIVGFVVLILTNIILVNFVMLRYAGAIVRLTND